MEGCLLWFFDCRFGFFGGFDDGSLPVDLAVERVTQVFCQNFFSLKIVGLIRLGHISTIHIFLETRQIRTALVKGRIVEQGGLGGQQCARFVGVAQVVSNHVLRGRQPFDPLVSCFGILGAFEDNQMIAGDRGRAALILR